MTGSSYLLTANSNQTLIIDSGLFQESFRLENLNTQPFTADIRTVSGVLLTHAHLDHCGRLPLLLKQGFNGPIYMTAPTKEITEISLLDSAKVAHHEHKDLYDENLVRETVKLFQVVNYGQPFSLGEFQIVYRNAGHILGSASIEISADNQKIVFSGDLGNSPEDLIPPTEKISWANAAVMETTYGDRLHPKDEPIAILQSEVNTVEETSGTLLIPAFSIERSQEILHLISQLKGAGKIKAATPIIFDSPMAEKVTAVFEKYLNSPGLFTFPGLFIGKNHPEGSGPKVILAGSGMMTGGKILDYARQYLPFATTRLLFVGYQANETLGRKILDGAQNISIEKTPLTINAAVNEIQSLSSHADQKQLLNWLGAINGLKKVFLTHGEDPARKTMAENIKNLFPQIETFQPTLNQEYNL